jgi:GDP-L-fucose synthase
MECGDDNVLVFGGSGFLGKRLRLVKPNWIYLSSSDCDLQSLEETTDLLRRYDNVSVVHLAGLVGGIQDNESRQAEYFYKNVIINANVLEACRTSGVKRLLCSLSTCAFPNVVDSYPFSEKDMFAGPPAPTNFSYGFTKRMLHVQCLSYRNQYGLNYSTFCPSNLYGPGDYFDKPASHFVASLISKVYNLKEGEPLVLWGTGKPLRQQLFVDDLSGIIPVLLCCHNCNSPIIVAPGENLSINSMAEILREISGKNFDINYSQKLEGQFRKDGNNEAILKLMDGYEFTPFAKGIKTTYEWYMENR